MVHIGVSQIDITPPVGIPLSGFANRDVCSGIHDPLQATALVAHGGGESFVVLDCDLLFIDSGFLERVRAGVQERTGLAAQNVMISCTHTHYGPDVCGADRHPIAGAYRESLHHRLVGAAQMACDGSVPARIGVSWGESFIGINRRELAADGSMQLGRNPTGPVDRSVGVCRIDTREGKPLAAIVNFQTHPVSLTGSERSVSAGFPGTVRQIVKQLTGATCLFFQGAGGDINPIAMQPDFRIPHSLGTRLGCETVRLWEQAETEEPAVIGVRTKLQALPRYLYGSREFAEALQADLQNDLTEQKSKRALPGLVQWTETRLERIGRAVQSRRTGKPLEPVQAEFQAYRLGDLAWATAPGEIFNELGRRVKQASPFRDTFFVSNTNGTIGYVPVPEAYSQGGYEVNHAGQVEPEAAGTLVAACGDLLASLAGA